MAQHDKTDQDGPDVAMDILDGGVSTFFALLAVGMAWLATAAVSLLFYPLAWLLGFKPRRWWVKEDGFGWGRVFRRILETAFGLAALLALLIALSSR